MSIKTIVNRLEYSKYVVLPIAICFALPGMIKVHNSLFYALETALVVFSLLTLLFRLFYAPWAMQRSEDPGLLYSVLTTLDKTSLWFAKRYQPEESYKPWFSTSQFVAEYNLSTEIGYGRVEPYVYLLATVLNLAVAWFLYYRFHQLWVAAIPLGSLVFFIFQLGKSRQRADDPTPIVSFTEQGLRIRDDNIAWKDIYEWRFVPGGKNEKAKFIISHANAATGIEDAVVEMPGLKTSRVDFLLLLIYFKAKYGQQ